MKKSKETDSSCDDQIQVIFKKERTALKSELDKLWNDAPAKARPVLDKMQKLIAITEEYGEVKENLEKSGSIIETIIKDRDHLVKSLLCLLNSIHEWKELRSENISSELRSFIEENAVNSHIRESVVFESDKLLNILTDAANKIDDTINRKNESQGSHMSGDDSEYMYFEKNNVNEISFTDAFKEER